MKNKTKEYIVIIVLLLTFFFSVGFSNTQYQEIIKATPVSFVDKVEDKVQVEINPKTSRQNFNFITKPFLEIQSSTVSIPEEVIENIYFTSFDPTNPSVYYPLGLKLVFSWSETVHRVYEEHKNEFTFLNEVARQEGYTVPQIILGVIYAESGGDRRVKIEGGLFNDKPSDNTYGLLQMNPRTCLIVPEFFHLNCSRARLQIRDQEFNIYIGMLDINRIVGTIKNDYVNEFYSYGDHAPKLYWALSFYNCGRVATTEGRCYRGGGPGYATEILEERIPALNYYHKTEITSDIPW